MTEKEVAGEMGGQYWSGEKSDMVVQTVMALFDGWVVGIPV